MTLLDLLKTRQHEQREAAAIDYWQLVDPQHKGSGRKNGDAVVTFEAALAKTGKTFADAETDSKLLADLAVLGDLDERQRVADAEVAKLKASAVAATAEADELQRKVEQLRKQADADRHRMRGIGQRMDAARGERGRVLRQLAQRGHPASVTALGRVAAESELRRIRSELVDARAHRDGCEETAKGRNDIPTGPLAKARRQVAEHEARERELVASLAELGGAQ